MDTKVNYVAVGLFVIALAAVLVGVALWLTAVRITEPTLTYVTYIHDEVSGLSHRSPVRFNGVKVGYVSLIELDKRNPQLVRVIMKIKGTAPITTATVATLSSEGITGVDYIALTATTANAPPLVAKPGEKHPVIPSNPSLFLKMSSAIQEITKSVSALTSDMRQMMDQQNRTAIKNTLLNVEKITNTIAANSENINKTLQSTTVLLNNTAEASKQFPKIVSKIDHTLTRIDNAALSMTHAGGSVTSMMDQSTKTVRDISYQIVPTAHQLMLHLDGLAESLQQMARDLKLNPSIIIRGKALSPLGPGEKK